MHGERLLRTEMIYGGFFVRNSFAREFHYLRSSNGPVIYYRRPRTRHFREPFNYTGQKKCVWRQRHCSGKLLRKKNRSKIRSFLYTPPPPAARSVHFSEHKTRRFLPYARVRDRSHPLMATRSTQKTTLPSQVTSNVWRGGGRPKCITCYE